MLSGFGMCLVRRIRNANGVDVFVVIRSLCRRAQFWENYELRFSDRLEDSNRITRKHEKSRTQNTPARTNFHSLNMNTVLMD